VYRSKRAQLFSHLESLGVLGAPSVRNFSRVWRVWCGVSLQTCATFPAFVVVLVGFSASVFHFYLLTMSSRARGRIAKLCAVLTLQAA